MARQLIVLFACVVGMALADDSGYGAPSSYAAQTDSGYGAPSSPGSGYGAPQDGYGAPSYQDPSQGYGAPTGGAVAEEETGLFDFDKLLELLPFFLAVFAAIILAQLLAPLLAMLPGVFAPFGNVKIDFINLLLSPFSLAICNLSTPPTIAGTPAAGRALASGFDIGSPENLDQITNFLFDAVKLYQSAEA
jgi:hypothetical protein